MTVQDQSSGHAMASSSSLTVGELSKRPSTSRRASSSKLGKQQDPPPCCSEASEVVLICCDSPACAAEDIAVCASDNGDIPDDCAECQQAAETGCTGDCLAGGAQEGIDDCLECLEEHRLKDTTLKKASSSKETRGAFSAVEAFDAEEPIQACDVPGCSALEWDEKAVDELLRCCCSSSGHHHQSFAIPSHNATPGQPRFPHQHQHSHVASTEHHHATSALLPQASNHAFHAHHHYHADCPEPPYTTSSQSSMLPPSTAGESIASQSTTSVTSFHSPFHHGGGGIDQSFNSCHSAQQSNTFPSAATRRNPPYDDHGVNCQEDRKSANVDKSHLSSFLPSHMSRSRSQSLPGMVHPPQPVAGPHSLESLANTANPTTFKCEWSSCSASFPSREELVGHVNVNHLLQAKATSTTSNPEFMPPTPAQSQISSTNRLSDITGGPNSMATSMQLLLSASSGAYHAHGQYHPNATGTVHNTLEANAFGNLQNQPTDPSFDHTLRCLWDSCQASLPMLGDSALATPSANQSVHPSHAGTPHTSGLSSNCFDNNAPLHTLPDQSTANLVRHLLQDHLHLPTDVLGQLSPALPLASNNTNDVTSQHVHGANNMDNSMSHHGSYMSSAPVSNHSTPHSMARPSTGNSPSVYKPPPTPPQAPPEQQYKFDFGLSSMPTFGSWPNQAPKEVHYHAQQSSLAAERDEQKVSDLHACKWKECSMAFANTAELMEHISSEHVGSGKSVYHCEWEGCDRACEGRGFNQRQKVMRHVRTHVGDKPFVCKECGRAFSESTTLAQHMRTHTNEKPFECPEPGCGKTFALQSALTIHMRVHTGEKPFKCPHPGCSMAFAESSNLSKHVKTHLPKTGLSNQEESQVQSIAGRKRRLTSVSSSEIHDGSQGGSQAKMLKA